MTKFSKPINKDVVNTLSLNKQERQNIQETFRKSGMHENGAQPKFVFAVLVCVLQIKSQWKSHTFRSQSEHGTHAETKIIDFLKKKMEQGQLFRNQTIKLFVNFSPCCDCSDELITYLLDTKRRRGFDIKLQISFPALYKINRPSCEAGNHSVAHNRFDDWDHMHNFQGLLKLRGSGVDLQVSGAKLWQGLADALGVPKITYGMMSPRRREDTKLSNDWQRLTSAETPVPTIFQGAGGPAPSKMMGVSFPHRVQEHLAVVAARPQDSHVTDFNNDTVVLMSDDEEHYQGKGRSSICFGCAIL